MFDSGRLVRRRSGAGYVVVVEDEAAFQAFVARTFKRATIPLSAATAGAINLIKWANTKGSRREGQTEGVLARAFSSKIATTATGTFDLSDITGSAGVAGFKLNPQTSLYVPGPVVLVENPELFWDWETYEPTCSSTLILKSGKASNVLLDWLASGSMAAETIIIAADYDPTGLEEYLRIKRKLGERVILPIPENLRALFDFFSNRNLLKPIKSAELLQKLRSEPDEKVQQVIKIIDEFRGGLEHEAFLISKTSTHTKCAMNACREGSPFPPTVAQ